MLFLGGIAFGGSTLAIPFRRKFKYWLLDVEQGDNSNLARCLHLYVSQVQLQRTKRGPQIKFHFRIFNGSVYTLSFVGVVGHGPIFIESHLET